MTSVMERLQGLCESFLEYLVDENPYLMPIDILQSPFDINTISEIQYEDHEEVSVTRNFDNFSSQKKYSQIFAVAALVMELVSSMYYIRNLNF